MKSKIDSSIRIIELKKTLTNKKRTNSNDQSQQSNRRYYYCPWASLVIQMVKNLAAIQETWI